RHPRWQPSQHDHCDGHRYHQPHRRNSAPSLLTRTGSHLQGALDVPGCLGRPRPRLAVRPGNGCQESIPFAADRLDELRFPWVVVQDLPDLPDGTVNAVVGVDINPVAPDPRYDLLPRDQLSTPLDQQQQDLQWGRLKLQRPASTPQFVAARLEFELLSKSNRGLNFHRLRHCRSPGSPVILAPTADLAISPAF